MMADIPQAESAPRSGESLEVRITRLEEQLKAETRLRETVTRSDKLALDKAESFIMEKSAEHNNLLDKMEKQAATFVTKQELEDARDRLFSRVLAIITISSAAVVVVNYIIRTYVK